jgi:hypothetical protein
MPPAVLPSIISGGLLAVTAKAIIDPIWPTVHRVDHAIRPDIGAGIKVGRAVIVQVNCGQVVRMPVMAMVMNVHISIGSE